MSFTSLHRLSLSQPKGKPSHYSCKDVGYANYFNLLIMKYGDAPQNSNLLLAPIQKTPRLPKGVGATNITVPTDLAFTLSFCEQSILSQIRSVVVYRPSSDRKLQLPPQWILTKFIQQEQENFRGYYKEGNCR